MKVLVVGGAGFIGSHLCEALLLVGDDVHCVDDFSLGKTENLKSIIDNRQFHLYRCDASNYEMLLDVFQQVKPEYVFHLAANSDIQASAADPGIEYKNTYTTTYQILACMRKVGVKKLFFASTSAVYGDKGDIVLKEDTPNLAPISYYGGAKLGSEALINAFTYMNDFSTLIFRFPNVIGPHLTHGVIFDFIHRLRDNPTQLRILGNGKQEKPYVYVDDLVRAIVQLRETELGVSIYNLGVEGSTSVTRIAEMIIEEMGLLGVDFIYTGGESGWKGDVPKFKYDLTKIHEVGWYAKLNSDEAVRRTVKEYLRRCI